MANYGDHGQNSKNFNAPANLSRVDDVTNTLKALENHPLVHRTAKDLLAHFKRQADAEIERERHATRERQGNEQAAYKQKTDPQPILTPSGEVRSTPTPAGLSAAQERDRHNDQFAEDARKAADEQAAKERAANLFPLDLVKSWLSTARDNAPLREATRDAFNANNPRHPQAADRGYE